MATLISRRSVLRAGVLAGGALAARGTLPGSHGPSRVAAAGDIQLTMFGNGDIHVVHLMQKLADIFHTMYPNLTLNATIVPYQNMDQRVDLLLAAGTPPDLWGPYGNRGYRYYASRGYFPSIDPLIAAEHYDLGDFYPTLINFCKWKGQHVGLPNDWYPSFLMYNKELFDRARLPYPPTDWTDRSWDYDKFLEYARALTVTKGGKTSQWGLDGPTTDGRFPFWIFGGDAFDAKGYQTGFPTQVTLNTPAVIDGLQFQSDLINKWKVQPTPAQLQAVQGGAPFPFANGKIAMSPQSSFPIAPLTFPYGVAALPWPPRRYGLPRKASQYPDQWLVFKGVKHPHESWLLQKFMVSPEALKLWIPVQGSLPSRKSLAGVAQAYMRAVKPDISAREMACALDSVNFTSVTPSHAIIPWSIIESQVIDPITQNLLLGHITGRQAVEQMIPKIQAILKQNPPQ
jgi:multiple sugar transport system substrate-binding protein